MRFGSLPSIKISTSSSLSSVVFDKLITCGCLCELVVIVVSIVKLPCFRRLLLHHLLCCLHFRDRVLQLILPDSGIL